MHRSPQAGAERGSGIRPGRIAALCLAAVAGLAVAVFAGLAVAKSFTLNVAKNVQVAGKSKNVVVGANGKTVYMLSGETSSHLLCNSQTCFGFWPPLKVAKGAKLSKAPGVNGKLGTLHRNGFFQVTLNGRPVYNFGGDGKRQANGEGIKSFGGTWHAVTASGSSKGANTTSTSSTTTTMTTTASSTSPYCFYPPCP
jgi:predicted lipoprotein with Yx(FWY)xxD motif